MGRHSVLPSLLAAVLIAGVLVAWSAGFWATSLLHLGVYSVALVMACSALLKPSSVPPWPRSFLYIPVALIAAWAPLQLMLGTTVYAFPTSLSALYWFTDLVVFAISALLLARSRTRSRFLAILMYFGCGIVVISILQSFTSPNKFFWMFESNYRVIGPFIYKNQFAAFVELIMPIALYRMLTDQKNATAFAFLSAVMFAAVLASASRTGTALLCAEVVFILFLGWRKGLVPVRTAGILFAQLIVMLVICAFVVGWEDMGRHFQDESSGQIRMNFLKSSLAMIRDHPGTGVGLGNWTTVYPAYALFDNGLFANAAHNDWAQWAAEGGLPFVVFLLWIFGVAIVSSWKNPWGIGVVSVLLHSFLDYPTREPVIGVILFSLLGAMVAADAKLTDNKVISMKTSYEPVR